MLHEMTLFPKPYASIASGQKTIELRLYDEKRQSIHIGDHIRFTNTEDASQTTLCEVVQLHVFKDFSRTVREPSATTMWVYSRRRGQCTSR